MDIADARQIQAAAMSEVDLLDAVLALCRHYQLLAHHCRPARTAKGWRTPIRGNAGFPDLVIAGRNDAIFRELKTEKGRLSTEQGAWLDTLTKAGHLAYVWRPMDLLAGRIREELEGLT